MAFNNIITIGAALAGAYYLANQGSKNSGGGSGSNDSSMMNMGVVPLPMPTPSPAPSDPEPESTSPSAPKDTTSRVEPDADAKFSAVAQHPNTEDIFGVKPSGNIEKVGDTTKGGGGDASGDYFSKY